MAYSLLSKPAILEHLKKGGIIIEPFNPDQLKSCSYDVSLGEWYCTRIQDPSGQVLNPYSKKAIINRFSDPQHAQKAKDHPLYNPLVWEGIEPDDLVIVFMPHEPVLGHTIEFIGGTKTSKGGACFTAEMKARSSIGRYGMEICRCAGWGDVGFVNRWTMEMVSDGPDPIVLVVGTCVAQMKIYRTAKVADKDLYGYDPGRDSYQTGINLAKIMETWKPEMMLPRPLKRGTKHEGRRRNR